MVDATFYDDSVTDVVSAGLTGATEDLLVVNPSATMVRELLRQLYEHDTSPSVRILVHDDLFNDLVDDFLVTSVLADLVQNGGVEVRILDEVLQCSLFIDNMTVAAILEAGEQLASVATEDPDIAEEFRQFYEDRWKETTDISLRTPPLSAVLESLAADIGQSAAADFEAILDSRQTVRGDNESLGEVTIALLVAARNNVLQYDISRWGEESGLASKATFSRTKNRVEETGIIETESVPIEVGRPRLRLLLDDEFADIPPAELADQIQSRLTGH
jgi:hypothetical protein